MGVNVARSRWRAAPEHLNLPRMVRRRGEFGVLGRLGRAGLLCGRASARSRRKSLVSSPLSRGHRKNTSRGVAGGMAALQTVAQPSCAGTGRHWRVRPRWLGSAFPPVGARRATDAQQLIEGKALRQRGSPGCRQSGVNAARSAAKLWRSAGRLGDGRQVNDVASRWGPPRFIKQGSEATTVLVSQRVEHQDLGREVALCGHHHRPRSIPVPPCEPDSPQATPSGGSRTARGYRHQPGLV